MDKQYNDEEEILREGWEKRWKQFLKAHDDFETIKNKVCSSLKGHIYITFFRGFFSNERYCCKQNPAAVWIEHQLLLKENNITKAMVKKGKEVEKCILQYAECFNKSNGQLHSKNAGN